jgi:hypothetical protein
MLSFVGTISMGTLSTTVSHIPQALYLLRVVREEAHLADADVPQYLRPMP